MRYQLIDQWQFALPPNTSWRQIFRWLNRYERMVFRVTGDDVCFWLPASIGDGFARLGPVDDQHLELELHHDGDLSRQHLETYLRWWWDLDRDMTPFYEAYRDDPLLGKSLTINRGARIVGVPDLFEALVLGIVGQQINVSFAHALKHRITETYGSSMDYLGETWWRFPTPQDIVEKARIEDLRPMQISQRKAEYVIGIAEAMHRGDFSRESLLTMDLAGQMAAMTAVRGIGAWTAQYVCMKCLHTMEAFVAGDSGVQNAVRDLLQMDRKPSLDELYELAIPWKDWQAYAVWFLWLAE
ncbi:MAG: DNA-3-methyladenine glycosylase [Bacteroidia bacterium]|nr:DNA-3-methyladenine glycosylase [Bacteroidia bacterium]